MTMTPYLNLPGNAEEALNFYKTIFGGTTEIIRWSEMPPNPKMPIDDGWRDKIMHSSLSIKDGLQIYLSDSWIDKEPSNNSVFLHLVFDSEDELKKVYDVLVVGGSVNMPVEKTFWGSIYGDLVDKFGTGWGLEYNSSNS